MNWTTTSIGLNDNQAQIRDILMSVDFQSEEATIIVYWSQLDSKTV